MAQRFKNLYYKEIISKFMSSKEYSFKNIQEVPCVRHEVSVF
jgi:hypothetical protein